MSTSTQQVKILNNVDDENYSYNGDLYKYLALNDTIHDFGKGHDRGDDINDIVKSILNEVPYKKYTPFGNNGLFSLSPFEANTEAFLLSLRMSCSVKIVAGHSSPMVADAKCSVLPLSTYHAAASLFGSQNSTTTAV